MVASPPACIRMGDGDDLESSPQALKRTCDVLSIEDADDCASIEEGAGAGVRDGWCGGVFESDESACAETPAPDMGDVMSVKTSDDKWDPVEAFELSAGIQGQTPGEVSMAATFTSAPPCEMQSPVASVTAVLNEVLPFEP